MTTADIGSASPPDALWKAPTGIAGFDDITRGGIPRGRVTLVMGGPGAGKTVFALQALVCGARDHDEPGIFVAFEENSRQIVANAATFGWDLPGLERKRLFFLDARLSPAIVQAGDFDLSAMLAALGAKADELGAKRIVFDGIDVLLTLLDDSSAERRELYRIYEWLQERGLTGIITAKSDPLDRPTSERYAFMQFMVDCVVVLQHRVTERVSMRSLRVSKYRGSGFNENEFPLVITESGIEVAVFGEPELRYPVFTERVSSGVPRLDKMLGGGYYRGTSVLISGAPGTAKTTLAGACVAAACARGERALWVSFDESADQIVRNLRSVGLELGGFVEHGLLAMHSIRTEVRGAEEHLVDLKRRLAEVQPAFLVLDPISALVKTGGHIAAVHASLRMLDQAKALGVTVLCTSLVAAEAQSDEVTVTQISTIADTWIHLAYLAHGGERNRTLTVVKSRGTRHSSQVRELVLSDEGVTLADVYSAGGEVLLGTARWEREAEMREAERRRQARLERKRRSLHALEAGLEARINALQQELLARRAELHEVSSSEEARIRRRQSDEGRVMSLRGADADTHHGFDARDGDGRPPSGGG